MTGKTQAALRKYMNATQHPLTKSQAMAGLLMIATASQNIHKSQAICQNGPETTTIRPRGPETTAAVTSAPAITSKLSKKSPGITQATADCLCDYRHQSEIARRELRVHAR